MFNIGGTLVELVVMVGVGLAIAGFAGVACAGKVVGAGGTGLPVLVGAVMAIGGAGTTFEGAGLVWAMADENNTVANPIVIGLIINRL